MRNLFSDLKKGGGGNAVAKVSAANLLKSAVGITSGILIAKWLLPEELGEFNALSIFTSYIVLAQIGLPSGLSRDLPFYYGSNQVQYANALAATAKFVLLWLSLITLIFSIVLAVYFFYIGENKYSIGSLVVGLTSFQGLYITKYLKILYRTNKHFDKLAKITFFNTVTTALSIILVYYYSFYGLCFRTILLVMVDGVLTHRWSPLKVIAKYEKQHLLALLKTGLPIYSVANVYGLWPTFQRSMILIDLGPKGLGLYSLSIIVQNTLNTFSNATSSVVFPKMTKAFGAGAKVKEILRIPLKMILIVFIIHCIILIVGWILLPYVVEYLLPKYVEGLEAAKWMLVVSLVSIFFIFSNFFMVVKKNNLRLISFLSGMGVWYIYIKNNIILTSVDLVVYSKGLLLGYITIFIIDSFFYLLILKNKIKV